MVKQSITTKIHAKNKTMNTEDIRLNSNVGQSKPNPDKLLRHFDEYAATGVLPRKILVDADNNIVDGLCTYLVAKTMRIPKVDVIVLSVSFS